MQRGPAWDLDEQGSSHSLDKVDVDNFTILREDSKEVALCQLVWQTTSEDVCECLNLACHEPESETPAAISCFVTFWVFFICVRGFMLANYFKHNSMLMQPFVTDCGQRLRRASSCKHMQGFLICRCVFRRHVRASLEWMSHHFPQILSESPSRSIGHRSPQQQCLRPRWSDHAHVIGPKDFLFRIGTTAIRNRSAHFQSIGPG